MSHEMMELAAGVDVGTEFVKAVISNAEGRILGRATIPTRGYFEACAFQALKDALDDATLPIDALTGIGATGFGMRSVPGATHHASESACHAAGAYHHLAQAMTVVNIGGRQPEAITVDADGRRVGTRGVRGCAVGLGDFLMFAARHLDVSPARFDELASSASGLVAPVTSYCSVFSSTAILERMREGARREEVALGCLVSIAERVREIGVLEPPIVVSGGVAEYFPGVLRALQTLIGHSVVALPDPIYTGALGGALQVFQASAVAARG